MEQEIAIIYLHNIIHSPLCLKLPLANDDMFKPQLTEGPFQHTALRKKILSSSQTEGIETHYTSAEPVSR